MGRPERMWNGTFVLHCAGWSLLFLGLFYLIIDVLGFWRWSFFFLYRKKILLRV